MLQPPTYAGLLQKHYSLLRKDPVPRKFGNWNGKRRRLSDCQHPRWAVDTHSCREKKVWVSVVSGLALSPTVCSDPSVTTSPASAAVTQTDKSFPTLLTRTTRTASIDVSERPCRTLDKAGHLLRITSELSSIITYWSSYNSWSNFRTCPSLGIIYDTSRVFPDDLVPQESVYGL